MYRPFVDVTLLLSAILFHSLRIVTLLTPNANKNIIRFGLNRHTIKLLENILKNLKQISFNSN